MSDPAAVHPEAAAAGAMLREARERQNLSLESLAATTKVSAAKLAALEAGRLQDLPDPTFARALAQAVARGLKIDAAPVLARMPVAAHSRLERVDEGINAPMPDGVPLLDLADWSPLRRPVPWLAGALLVAAAIFVWMPRGALDPSAVLPGFGASESATGVAMGSGGHGSSGAPGTTTTTTTTVVGPASRPAEAAPTSPPGTAATPDAGTTVAPDTAPNAAVTPPAPDAAAVSATAAASGPAGAGDELLVVTPQNGSWVEIRDASGRVVVSRLVPAGTRGAFGGRPPLAVKIGNVQGTVVTVRGQPVDLMPLNKGNVARLVVPAGG